MPFNLTISLSIGAYWLCCLSRWQVTCELILVWYMWAESVESPKAGPNGNSRTRAQIPLHFSRNRHWQEAVCSWGQQLACRAITGSGPCWIGLRPFSADPPPATAPDTFKPDPVGSSMDHTRRHHHAQHLETFASKKRNTVYDSWSFLLPRVLFPIPPPSPVRHDSVTLLPIRPRKHLWARFHSGNRSARSDVVFGSELPNSRSGDSP